jgi:hypothetical protein
VPKFQGFKGFHFETLKPCNIETLWYGAVAQLGERLVCNQEATGSIPVSSTRNVEERPFRAALAGRKETGFSP